MANNILIMNANAFIRENPSVNQPTVEQLFGQTTKLQDDSNVVFVYDLIQDDEFEVCDSLSIPLKLQAQYVFSSNTLKSGTRLT